MLKAIRSLICARVVQQNIKILKKLEVPFYIINNICYAKVCQVVDIVVHLLVDVVLGIDVKHSNIISLDEEAFILALPIASFSTRATYWLGWEILLLYNEFFFVTGMNEVEILNIL